jgi:glyoxylate utilization-related uncharacterized protein
MKLQNTKELATPTDLNRAVAGNASFIVQTSVTIVVETIAVAMTEMLRALLTTRPETGMESTMGLRACSLTG